MGRVFIGFIYKIGRVSMIIYTSAATSFFTNKIELFVKRYRLSSQNYRMFLLALGTK
jgi:hypothetical protein